MYSSSHPHRHLIRHLHSSRFSSRGSLMRFFSFFPVLVAALLPACAYLPQHENGIWGVVADGVRPELVQEGFIFTKDPLGAADGGLYFTDLRNAQRVYRMDPDGKMSVLREKSNNANGLAYMPNGELVAAEGLGKRISRIGLDSSAAELTAGDGERPLMAPNDLIADAKGGIYFT